DSATNGQRLLRIGTVFDNFRTELRPQHHLSGLTGFIRHQPELVEYIKYLIRVSSNVKVGATNTAS
ncbi:hypothetical protein OFN42_25570, partial [Escherichia coli]|nr:hypothetical protein [Escherichia coli]